MRAAATTTTTAVASIHGRRLRSARVVAAIAALAFWLSGQAPIARGPLAPRWEPAFVEQRGQWDGSFLYEARLGAMTVFLEKDGLWFVLVERSGTGFSHEPALGSGPPRERGRARGAAVRMRFTDGSRATVIAEERSEGVHHYFLGNDPSRWRTDVPRHRSVLMRGIRPGVDVRMRFEDGHLEYDVLVSAGVDLDGVSIGVEGADGLRLDGEGGLVIETPLGPVVQPSPRTWQIETDGRREPLHCEYALLGPDRFGFRAPERKPDRPMVVDPGLVFSTALGGATIDQVRALALDPTAAPTVAGITDSTAFPATPGAFDPTWNANTDMFVTRFDASLSTLVYSTFIGGASHDQAEGLAMDGGGGVAIGGWSLSSNFPTTSGAYDTTWSGGDAVVVRLDASGSGLVYSTFLGGGFNDQATAVALDAAGAVTVAGWALSDNFPTTVGAYDTTFNGGEDAFVARLDPTGSSLVYATFLGGTLNDRVGGIALDATGAATVTGGTSSPGFPVTPGAHDTTFSGGDAFVARIDPTGTSLVYSTLLGGSGSDGARAVVLDPAGCATLGGTTGSLDFPTTPGAYDATYNGGFGDAFVARLDATGSVLVSSTLLGGADVDGVGGLAIDAMGRATIVGKTHSFDFPTTPGAYDTTFSGGGFPFGASDVYVARLDQTGGALVYSTYFGGLGSSGVNAEDATCVVIDPTGAATVAGMTDAVDFPSTPGSFDGTFNGPPWDGFVFRLYFDTPAYPVMMFPEAQTVSVGGNYGAQIVGPPGALLALMFDPVPQSLPIPPHGALGVGFPPQLIVDGIGFGLPGSIPVPLLVGPAGLLYFTLGPIPPSVAGTTCFGQAVAVHGSLPGGVALSTHGGALPTPACQVTVLP